MESSDSSVKRSFSYGASPISSSVLAEAGLYVSHTVLIVSLKMLVKVLHGTTPGSFPCKGIHIELPKEGIELAGLKVVAEHRLIELQRFED